MAKASTASFGRRRESGTFMKKKSEAKDELRPEYDFRSMKVVKVGPGRGSNGRTVTLDSDVAEMFPTSASVNEALRLLLRATKKGQAAG